MPDLERLAEIRMELTVQFGETTHGSLGDLLQLGVGSVIALGDHQPAPAVLMVEGRAVARGEIITADHQYAIKITQVLEDPAS